MTVPIPLINTLANHIQEWGEPYQYPWKKMGLSRTVSIALACVEAYYFLSLSTALIVYKLPGSIPNHSLSFLASKKICFFKIPQNAQYQLRATNFKREVVLIASIVAGLVSTVIFGIIFSPEVNFYIHLKCGLVISNTAEKKERDLRAKIELENKDRALRIERENRIGEYKKNEDIKNREDLEIDDKLALLLAMN